MLRSSLPPLRFLLNKSKSVFALDLLKEPRNKNTSIMVNKKIPSIMFPRESKRRLDPLARNLRLGMASALDDIVSFPPLVVLDEDLFRRVDADECIDVSRLCGDANLWFLWSPEHCWIPVRFRFCDKRSKNLRK